MEKIIEDLNKLLDESLSPHAISYEFDRIAQIIREQQISVAVVSCKSYYKNDKLQQLFEEKAKLWDNRQFEKAASVHQRLKDELKMLEGNGDTILHTEVSRFEQSGNLITAYLNEGEKNHPLILSLVEYFGINVKA